MSEENWYLDVRDKESGTRKENCYELILEKWIKTKVKPKLILLDRWIAGDELIAKLQAIGLPVEGMKFKKL